MLSKIPGLSKINKARQAIMDPVGFVIDQTTGKRVETSADGEQLSEIDALMVKIDRVASNQETIIDLLVFLARQTNPDEFDKTFKAESAEQEQEEILLGAAGDIESLI